jgi:hypothetical protein
MHILIDLYLYAAAWLPIILLVMTLCSGRDFPPGSAFAACVLAFAFGFATWVGLLTINTFFS